MTIVKSVSNDENRFKRLNIQKISSLKDLLNKPVSEISFNLKSFKEIDLISDFIKEEGSTVVKIKIADEDNDLIYELKNRRRIDRKSINIIRNKDISTIIH